MKGLLIFIVLRMPLRKSIHFIELPALVCFPLRKGGCSDGVSKSPHCNELPLGIGFSVNCGFPFIFLSLEIKN